MTDSTFDSDYPDSGHIVISPGPAVLGLKPDNTEDDSITITETEQET